VYHVHPFISCCHSRSHFPSITKQHGNQYTPIPANYRVPTHCNASTTWLPSSTTFSTIYPDCMHASLSFAATADEYGDQIFEFHAAGVRPTYAIEQMVTPRRYTYRKLLTPPSLYMFRKVNSKQQWHLGSCIILIANLYSFPLAWLPTIARRPYEATDVAYYHDLSEAVGSVLTDCMERVSRPRKLGWANGAKQSRMLGEFLGLCKVVGADVIEGKAKSGV